VIKCICIPNIFALQRLCGSLVFTTCHFYFASHSLSEIKITHKQVNNYTHAHIAKISAIFLPLHHQNHEPMSKPISTIFGDILRRAQLDPTDPRYASLLAIEGDMSDDAYRAITDSLSEMMTADEARNNADVQRHFRQRSCSTPSIPR
jgi:hypothetical protein